jgi:hypothetical protein
MEKIKQVAADNWKWVTLLAFMLTLLINTANVSSSYSNISTRVQTIERDLDKKADKEVINMQLRYIIQSLEELKQDVKELKKR